MTTSPDQSGRLPALCPYCGHGHALAPDKPRPLQCESCKGRFEPLSRQATQNAMGPWQIRDAEQPFRPPCSYETIARLAQRGKITPTTIVRGPTTRQFWAYARDTPGIAAILGLCHSCHTAVSPDDRACPSCEAELQPKTDRQQLGLSPVAALPGEAPPEQIAALIRPRTPQPMPPVRVEPVAERAAEHGSEAVEPIFEMRNTEEQILDARPQRSVRQRGERWPNLVIGVQAVLIVALISAIVWLAGPFSETEQHTQGLAAGDAPPAVAEIPAATDSGETDLVPREETGPEQPTPDEDEAADLDTLMDDAMRPYESRYWRLVEGTRSDDLSTLVHAVDRLRALRAEAAAADPDAEFPLTDDLIAMATERLDQLRLLEEFEKGN